MTSYFHGGAPGIRRWIEPPSVSGEPSTAIFGAGGVCRKDRVYVTTDIHAAMFFAAMHPSGKGVVYRVKPVGELTADPDCDQPGLSYECERAEVVNCIRLTGKQIKKIRKAVLA